jgi:hypothetical protein
MLERLSGDVANVPEGGHEGLGVQEETAIHDARKTSALMRLNSERSYA